MAPMSRLTVDLDALAHNHAVLAREAAGAEVAPVVKADGYGLGAAEVSRRLWAEGARSFYVARLAEGEALRAALPEATIRVFDGATPGSSARLEAARLIPVLNSLEQAEAWRGPAALHIDTGMNRLGLRLEEAERLKDPGRIDLIISHLACAPDPVHPLNTSQLDRFNAARALFPNARASFANSAGTFLGQTYRFDQVRPGISLYGGGPMERPDARLKTVATFEAPILQVRDVPKGESVGYGAAFTAERPTQVAILGAGYADGLLRSWSPRGEVWFEGRRLPLLGRVSMDMIAVDVTGKDARPGAMVELLGPHIAVDDAATAAGTSAYELLVRLGTRAERRFIP